MIEDALFPDDVPDEEVSKAPDGYYTDLHVVELTPLDIDLITTAVGVISGHLSVQLNDKGVDNYERVMLRFLDLSEKFRPAVPKDA